MSGRILIADDAATNRIILKTKLASARYDVQAVVNGAELIEAVKSDPPDLVILHERLPDGTGADFCCKIKSMALARDIPVVLLTATDDPVTRVLALEAGADDYLTTPLEEMTLLARVRSRLRARRTALALRQRQSTVEELGFSEAFTGFEMPGRVAIVSTNVALAELWKSGLSEISNHKIILANPDDTLDLCDDPKAPDVIVIADDTDQGWSSLRLLSEIRSRELTRHAAVLLVHAVADHNTAVTALDLGANDILAQGFSPNELAIRVKTQLRRKREEDQLRASVEEGLRLSVVDPLTGLFNRRYAIPHARRMAADAQAAGRGFAVLLADLDRFKAINDTHGHPAGDAVLSEIAVRMKRNLRGADMIARIGGEEFMIILPDVDGETAHNAAQRLRRAVMDEPIVVGTKDTQISITISIGLALVAANGRAPAPLDDLIERADRALYRAKARGRNRVTVHLSAA